jgi:hypothetical protein
MGECLSFQVFHHQKIHGVLLAHVVKLTDVRMAQAGDSFRLALETLTRLRFTGKMRGKNFEGNDAVKPCVSCPINLTHAAGADRRDNLVRAEPS